MENIYAGRNDTVVDVIQSIFEELRGRIFKSLIIGVLLCGIFLLLANYFLNPIINYLQTVFVYTETIVTILLVPILEEHFKRVAIHFRTTFFYTFFFAGIEFMFYTLVFLSYGGSYIEILAMRSPAVLLHIVTVLIQKKHANDGNSKLGYKFAVAVHMLFNLVSSL